MRVRLIAAAVAVGGVAFAAPVGTSPAADASPAAQATDFSAQRFGGGGRGGGFSGGGFRGGGFSGGGFRGFSGGGMRSFSGGGMRSFPGGGMRSFSGAPVRTFSGGRTLRAPRFAGRTTFSGARWAGAGSGVRWAGTRHAWRGNFRHGRHFRHRVRFASLVGLGAIWYGASYYYPYTYVDGPYCSGVTPDGCVLRWVNVPGDGYPGPRCVAYCPAY